MAEDGEVGQLAAQLDRLIRSSRRDGRRWTNDEIAEQLKERHPQLRLSGAYLSAIRTGKRRRPAPELLSALAEFFGVPVAYFHDPAYAARIDAQLALLNEFHDSEIRSIALRAVGLPVESLAAVSAVLDQLRKQQGLPEAVDKTTCQGGCTDV